MAMAALQYHDVDRGKGLAYRLEQRGDLRRLFSDEETERAAAHPPAETRAFFRGACVDRFAGALLAANWDSLLFDVGEASLKRVPMMEPRRGTRALVGELLDSCRSAADMLRALGE